MNQVVSQLAKSNNNIITWKKAKENNVSFSTINKLVKQKQLKRLDRGVYVTNKSSSLIDDMFLLQNKYPKCIFSFYTSAYLHNLGDYVPNKLDVTFPHGYKLNYDKNKIKIHAVSRINIYKLGIELIKNNFNNKIYIYDKEKTICDLIKYESKLDSHINNKIFRQYFLQENINYEKLYRYAKIMNIEKKVFLIKELLHE